jgi:hypothetical protein
LQSHEDVPEDLREQLFAEEEQRLERQRKSTPYSTPGFPPINITNVLPTSMQITTYGYLSRSNASSHDGSGIVALNIPGPQDVAVRMYSEWQQSKVVDVTLKAEFQKACNATLDNGLDRAD